MEAPGNGLLAMVMEHKSDKEKLSLVKAYIFNQFKLHPLNAVKLLSSLAVIVPCVDWFQKGIFASVCQCIACINYR